MVSNMLTIENCGRHGDESWRRSAQGAVTMLEERVQGNKDGEAQEQWMLRGLGVVRALLRAQGSCALASE